ncbi:DUF1285 domain-containing protein [Breoghania sp. L-A4]|uniref:DUF1285 domain-containing protein n=1 Tax=Breoghania sp. L-A4 TaxID=2304600 RepID=UPI003204EAEA
METMPKGLQEMIRRAGPAGRGPAPVELWEPDFCGDLDMRIAADGTWFYMGTPIGREALVRLFSTVLRRDADGRYYLVTPVEKIGIQVEDVPFVGVELFVDRPADASGEREGGGQRLSVRTNVGDVVVAGEDHPLRFVLDRENGGLIPYILVRGRLEARLARPLLYELAELGEVADVEGTEQFGVWSDGCFFAMMQADEIAKALE